MAAQSAANGIVKGRPDQMPRDLNLPPPSTLADQLVEHQQTAATHAGHAVGTLSFELLEEVQKSLKESDSDPEAEFKLVLVIADAGLDLPSRESPFQSDVVNDETARQVSKCLDIIQLILERNPAVLVKHSQPNGSPQSMLCFLLLSRLVSLTAYDPFQSDLDRLKSLTRSPMLQDPDFWPNAILLCRLYQLAVTDLLSSIELLRKSVSSKPYPSEIVFPTVSMVDEIEHGDSLGVAMIQGRKATLKSPVQVLVAAIALLNAMLLNLKADVADTDHMLLKQHGLWIVKTSAHIWRLLTYYTKPGALKEENRNASVAFFDLLITLTAQDLASSVQLPVLNQAVTLLATATEFMVSKQDSWSDEKLSILVLKALSIIACSSSQAWSSASKSSLNSQLSKIVRGDLSFSLSHAVQAKIEGISKAMGQDTTRPPHSLSLRVAEWARKRPLVPAETLELPVLSRATESFSGAVRAAKRQKTGPAPSEDYDRRADPQPSIRAFCCLLGNWNSNDLSSLVCAAPDLFADLSDMDQLAVLDLFGSIQCQSGSIVPVQVPDVQQRGPICQHCSQGRRSRSSGDVNSNLLSQTLGHIHNAFMKILESPIVQHSKQLRLSGMIAIQKMACHSASPDQLNLSTSPAGLVCLQGIRSSSRELRLVSSRTLALFLAPDIDFEDVLCGHNCRIALNYLRDLAQTDQRMLETIICALGSALKVCTDEEVATLVLLQLLEFLGNTNPFIVGQAHLELRNLAHHFGFPVSELLRPYWSAIAVPVIKDLIVRPQRTQQVADILGISVNQVLVLTRQYVVPYMLVKGEMDVLHRIAHAMTPAASAYDVCVGHPTLSNVLSYVLTSYPDTAEQVIRESFLKVDPNFRDDNADMLVRVDPVANAREILKIVAGTKDNDKTDAAVRGFRELTSLVERRGHATRTTTTQARMTTLFLENHALGIMASFSDAIESPTSALVEKKRNLRAIAALIQIGGRDIAIAIPQMRACLQSALEVRQLCDDAFSVWLGLLNVAEAEELESLINQTFTIVARRWTWFNSLSQKRAYDAMARLLQQYGPLIQDAVDTIPSLAAIEPLSKFEASLARLRNEMGTSQRLASFARRCQDDNALAIQQTLEELLPFLKDHQQWIYDTTTSEQPMPVVADLLRSLLDSCAKFNDAHPEISDMCSQCLGIIGCVDSNRIEILRDQNEILMLSNFISASEAVDFAVYLLKNVLVKAFHAVSNPRAQGFLAYVMQELLRFCGFTKDHSLATRPPTGGPEDPSRRWTSLPEGVKNTLTPFLSSRYVLTTNAQAETTAKTYPLFSPRKSHGSWLRDLTLELLGKAKGDNAQMIFKVLARVIRGYDLSIAALLLPFAAANIIIDGVPADSEIIGNELLAVLRQPTAHLPADEVEHVKQCSENVFQVVDYLSRWLQEKKRTVMTARAIAERANRRLNAVEENSEDLRIKNVEAILGMIPPEVMSQRARECGSFTRALLHLEQHLREYKLARQHENDRGRFGQKLQRLQNFYMQLDEPDGVDGISGQIFFLEADQQAFEHQLAGRWDAARSWWEVQLAEDPQNTDVHSKYLDCLKGEAEFGTIVDHANAAGLSSFARDPKLLSAVSQAAWTTESWDTLERLLPHAKAPSVMDFNTGLGTALVALKYGRRDEFSKTIDELRNRTTKKLSASKNKSLQSCHEQMLQLHTLHELQTLATIDTGLRDGVATLSSTFARRLDVLGSSIGDKQYMLSMRRAVMGLIMPNETSVLSSSWIKTAKLARKTSSITMSYHAMFQAAKMKNESARIEQAKLLWRDGEHRKAIQFLRAALSTNKFSEGDEELPAESAATATAAAEGVAALPKSQMPRQNRILASAQLLLARWLDEAGQTKSEDILMRYRAATYSFQKWEKGFYYLGRFYNKLHDSEKALPPSRQSYRFLDGEMSKLVVENYLRSLTFGCKNLSETLPKLLTLWLELGDQVSKQLSKEVPEEIRKKTLETRPKMFDAVNKQLKKYAEKIVSFVFYTSLPQMLTRITHGNAKVWELLSALIVKVVSLFPQQALWSVLAVVKSTDISRARRGTELVNRLKDRGGTIRNEGQSVDLRDLVTRGQKLTEELVRLCDVQLDGRSANVSLTQHLGFRTKVAPCPLVIPWEKMLTASLPAGHTNHIHMRAHKPFPATREAVTISSFDDNVLVLNSLQRPRKILIKGSDGRKYGLMCKPHDDLRKDQRLMEFNGMINRALKKDSESAIRHLRIGTYAVTPLNELCGVLEWVEGLKPMRDILISLYKAKGIKVDYALLRDLLSEACADPPQTTKVFSETILGMYRPILHEWFTEHFPAPDAWYAARTRYTRSAAASSMVGHALGLGDRHGENVLLVEHDGSVFHVDFNCLFDKGLTFEKPELVPFRLTHNMVDAMGVTGVDGFFRKAAECTMRMMREQEDALLTNLETFVHDPTTDFVGARRRPVRGVPESPKEVLESVRAKVEGYMMGESLKLSVQGHVEALIKQAVDPTRLAAMYIGWCAFL